MRSSPCAKPACEPPTRRWPERLKAAEAVGPLLELVRRPPDPVIQAEAVEALGRIGGPEVRGVLAGLAENGPVLARLQAAEALERMRREETTA